MCVCVHAPRIHFFFLILILLFFFLVEAQFSRVFSLLSNRWIIPSLPLPYQIRYHHNKQQQVNTKSNKTFTVVIHFNSTSQINFDFDFCVERLFPNCTVSIEANPLNGFARLCYCLFVQNCKWQNHFVHGSRFSFVGWSILLTSTSKTAVLLL